MKKNTARLLGRLIFGPTFDNDNFVESMLYEIEDVLRLSGYARLTEAFYYAKYLPIQEKLYEDIRMTIGDVDLVKIEDLSKLKYLQAVVKETMRMKPIAPLAIPHKTANDTTLMGTKVARGTQIMVNLYALHHNEDIWPEPYKFMPERFLQGEDGSANNKAMEQSFLPFGAGMRICAGMNLGKLQIAFALANLVNAFKWSCVDEEFQIEAEVYTLGSSSWRRVGEVPLLVPRRSNVLLNETLHWLAICEYQPSLTGIGCFDIKDEKFRFVPLASQIVPNTSVDFDLGVLGGCLSIIDYSKPEDIQLNS
ncbi:hypothetical protein IFM89_021659 [Coptis chinensis]|uniref:Cytochrome P450 n=1 Tax=Coptis chinensis TaxID=261450 RepID=A0A835IG26_9MAGN|nr:hypothetical protein IFM89_021659 [Coptis chinensis]